MIITDICEIISKYRLENLHSIKNVKKKNIALLTIFVYKTWLISCNSLATTSFICRYCNLSGIDICVEKIECAPMSLNP